MVTRIAKAAAIPRPHQPTLAPPRRHHPSSRRRLPATRNAQILARHADPRTTEHYDRARGNLDRHGVHFLTANVAGVRRRRTRPARERMPTPPETLPSPPPFGLFSAVDSAVRCLRSTWVDSVSDGQLNVERDDIVGPASAVREGVGPPPWDSDLNLVGARSVVKDISVSGSGCLWGLFKTATVRTTPAPTSRAYWQSALWPPPGRRHVPLRRKRPRSR